ncbi:MULTISPECIES: hypothetical protein [unclassified Micromonospora]|uniref:hypothetical protein n=1 Tax=unclassified Micromonospora TaxID=2617518 RepID=UPI001C22E6C9|nr:MULTISPECIES: hypothetical protein [unclassified Micromonospora]MBU8857485.1 hypothetical protein [Micromonospora sp. WMMB482]MDM4783110.1 hypothetical protein [Micromonospora sp. b486]
MPASVAPAEKSTPTLLTVLFWVGVGLAPLAALILLIADGNGSLRFGAVVAILAVVLIGLSIALRPESGSGGAASEELREELVQLRRELRAEIVAAAQRGNQALDQARRAEEVAGAVRHRLDAAAAGLASAPASASASTSASAPERPSGAARVPVTGTPDAGRAHPASRDDDEPARPAYSGGRYGTDYDTDPPRTGHHDADPSRGGHYEAEPSRAGRYDAESSRAGRYGAESPGVGRYDSEPARTGRHDAEPARATVRPDRPASGVYGAGRVPERVDRPETRPVGVVHHTETVHVTTRHTIVGGGEPTGTRYGGFRGGWQDEDRSRGADAADHWRTGHRDPGRDDRSGRRAGSDEGGRGAAADGHSWTDPGRPGTEHPWAGVGRAAAGEHGWSGPSAGDQGWSGRTAGGGWSSDQGRTDVEEQRHWSGGDADRAGRSASDWPSAAANVPADGRAGTDGDQWSEMRAGNRWAAVRDDGAGREIRLGERRAAVHADGGGTEYRVEDRWASVRGGGPDANGPGGPDARWSGESHPGLPAGGVPVPDEWRPPTQRSGQAEWRQPPPEWRQPGSEWRQPESEWRQAEPEWRQPDPEWRRPEPERWPAEPEWRNPEHGGHGRPPRDTGDRWR